MEGEREIKEGGFFSEIGSTDVAAMSALLEYRYSAWQPQKTSSQLGTKLAQRIRQATKRASGWGLKEGRFLDRESYHHHTCYRYRYRYHTSTGNMSN